MTKVLTTSLVAVAALGFGTANAGPFDPADPRVFARAEDQERARLLTTPCAAGEIGRGCYRYDGRAVREAPCSFHIDAHTIGSLPTDQCYKMQARRRYRGVWVDEFEGQRFIPEGTTAPEWPHTDPRSPGWEEKAERARLASIWFDTSRIKVEGRSRQRRAKRLIEFISRQTMYPGAYGQFGMFGHEIIVDRLVALRECPATGSCG